VSKKTIKLLWSILATTLCSLLINSHAYAALDGFVISGQIDEYNDYENAVYLDSGL